MTGDKNECIKYLLEQEDDKLFDVKEHKDKRSNNANRLLWVCLGRIAKALKTDSWSVYMQMLKRYGTFTYICVKPSAVEGVKRQWRECEEIGELTIKGKKAVQLLCYYGSSTYNTQEFSEFLESVISEMEEMNIPTPREEEIERALKQWEENQKNQ
jgi:hypothetical protein